MTAESTELPQLQLLRADFVQFVETSHDAYQVSESCSKVSLCVPAPREACAHPLTLPSGADHTLTVLALLPGAAPLIPSEVYVCVFIYIKAVH